MTKTTTRLYLVESPSGKALVEASHPSAAIRHVSAGMFKCRLPTTKEVADLVSSGVRVQAVGDDASQSNLDFGG